MTSSAVTMRTYALRGNTRGTVAIVVAVVALVLVHAPGAWAATTLGQLFTPTASCSNSARLQVAAPGGSSYEVPSAGVISSWSFRNGAQPAQGLKFKVARPGGGTRYTIIGEGAGGPQTANTVTTKPTRVSVKGGDYFGIYVASGQCYLPTSFQFDIYAKFAGDPALGSTSEDWPYSSYAKIPVQVKLEADGDKDGFGDETQDNCAGTAGTANGCPPGPGGGGDPGADAPAGALDTSPPELRVDRPRVRRRLVLAYSVSEVAEVTVTVLRKQRGKRVRGRCVRASKRTRGARRCTRLVAVARVEQQAGAGRNTLALPRRAGRPLPPGRYRVRLTAVDAAGNVSAVSSRSFRIRRR